MKKTLLALSTSALLLGASVATVAQPYFIGQIGKSEIDTDFPGDDSDTYLGIGVGFDISRNFAVEVAYKNYGEVKGDNWSAEASSFSAAAVGKLPLSGSFELFGKIGLDLWESDIDYPGPRSEDDDGFDLFLGFGGAFNVNSRTDITLSYEVHEFEDLDVDVLALGVEYGF